MEKLPEKKKVFIENLQIGEVYTGEVFGFKDFTLSKDGKRYEAVMYDRTGQMPASMPAAYKEGLDDALVDGSYQVDISVKYENTGMVAMIKKIQKGSCGPFELVKGLSEDRRDYYNKLIAQAFKWVCEKDTSGVYSRILKAYLTPSRLSALAVKPAGCRSMGLYAGGALAVTATLPVLARDILIEHSRCANGLYDRDFDMVLVLTATLMSMCGIFAYVDDDMNKSAVGYQVGYYGLCQRMVDMICLEHGISLSDERVCLLLNAIQCMVSARTGMKNVSREGMVCRSVYFMYRELDQMERALSEAGEEAVKNGICYSPWLNRYLYVPESEDTEEGKEREHVS